MTKAFLCSVMSIFALLVASSDAEATVNDDCADPAVCLTASNSASGGAAFISNCAGATSGIPNACLQITLTQFGGPPNIADAGYFGAQAGVGVRALSTTNNAILAQNTVTNTSAAVISAVTASSSALSYWGGGGIKLIGGFAQKAGGGAWSAPSDERIKKDIVDYRPGLAELKRVHPVTFRYNGLAETVDDGKQYVGVIAQELQKVLPEMVTTTRQKLRTTDLDAVDVRQVDPSAFTYILINAVQEQQSIIERQEGRIQALERMLSSSSPSFSRATVIGLFALPLGLLAALRRRGTSNSMGKYFERRSGSR